MQRFDEFLIDLERPALVHVLSELVARHPEMQPEAEALCEAALAVYAGGRTVTPVDLAVIQNSLRKALRAGGSRRSQGIGASVVAKAIAPWLAKAREHLAAGEGAPALEILAVIADEVDETADAIYAGCGDDLEACALEIADGLAKALLLANPTAEERRAWESRIEIWSESEGLFYDPDLLRGARLAARHGWEYPPLAQILNGEMAEPSGYANRTGGVVPVLGPIMLGVLEQQRRWEEFARLSAALSGDEP